MKITLHIGTHKTGTTAIQHFAHDNPKLLAKYGIYWPEEALKANVHQHSILARMIMTGEADVAKAYIARAIAAAERSGASMLFLSGEGFCHFGEREVAVVAEMFRDHDLHVIVNFRNIYDYGISALIQTIKYNHRMAPLRAIVAGTHRNLDYAGVIRTWEAVAPGDRLDVRCYDLEKNRLLQAFYGRFGIPEAEIEKRLPKTPRKQNLSLDFATQLLLSASGYSNSINTFHKVRDMYAKHFAGMDFQPPAVRIVARALCAEGAVQLDHPKLAAIQDVLTREPWEPGDATSEQVSDYLARLSRFTAELARYRRRKLILDRLMFWR
ncbi:MAG: hypothetical protein EP335_04850 [Alphaproteobacteria bacterium]|nr:MAG: hypothetical protein EP335_04850 [Alphaproteobacteria bacterium]